MSAPDGGPAFPVQDCSAWQFHGMSVRDYFAAHCDQPGAWEITAAAGLIMGPDHKVYDDADQPAIYPTFNHWWANVEIAERFRLYAQVRYQMADAMIAARSTPHQEAP